MHRGQAVGDTTLLIRRADCHTKLWHPGVLASQRDAIPLADILLKYANTVLMDIGSGKLMVGAVVRHRTFPTAHAVYTCFCRGLDHAFLPFSNDSWKVTSLGLCL